MKHLSLVLAVVLLAGLAGCSRTGEISVLPEDEQAARHYVDLLRQGDFARIAADTDPAVRPSLSRDALAKMAAAIPPGEPASVKVVAAAALTGETADGGFTQNMLTLEYAYPDAAPARWLVVGVALRKAAVGGAAPTLAGFRITPLPSDLATLNRFTLAGKTPLHYLVLVLALVIPVFTLYAAFVLIRTPLDTWKKALWMAAIVAAVGRFTIDWTFGLWSLKPFSLLLFGTAAYAPPYGAWQVSFGLPLGAAAFLLWRRSRAAPRREAQAGTPLNVAHKILASTNIRATLKGHGFRLERG